MSAWEHIKIENLSVDHPFNLHEWPRKNFSLQFQFKIKQTSDENKEKFVVDPTTNSPNQHPMNYMADIKENY